MPSIWNKHRPLACQYLLSFGLKPSDVLEDNMDAWGYWSHAESDSPYYTPTEVRRYGYQQKYFHTWPTDFLYSDFAERIRLDLTHQTRRTSDRQAAFSLRLAGG